MRHTVINKHNMIHRKRESKTVSRERKIDSEHERESKIKVSILSCSLIGER